jgi:hypothetical protein
LLIFDASIINTANATTTLGRTNPKTECIGIHGHDENTFSCFGTDTIKSSYTCEDTKEDECPVWAERGEW